MAVLNPYNYKKPKQAIKAQEKTKPKLHEVKRKITKKEKYLQQKIMSAKPQELTMMLYDGLVRFLKQGKMFLKSDHISFEKVNNSLQRGQSIINELRSTLDMDIEISQNLDLLYDYMTRRLLDANLEKDVEILDEIIGLSEELRDTWKEAMESV